MISVESGLPHEERPVEESSHGVTLLPWRLCKLDFSEIELTRPPDVLLSDRDSRALRRVSPTNYWGVPELLSPLQSTPPGQVDASTQAEIAPEVNNRRDRVHRGVQVAAETQTRGTQTDSTGPGPKSAEVPLEGTEGIPRKLKCRKARSERRDHKRSPRK